METEICQDCGRTIGNLETRFLFEGRIVCKECDVWLRATEPPTQSQIREKQRRLHEKERSPFYSRVVGVTDKNANGTDRQQYIKTYCRPRQPLILKREPDNPHDKNAIGVWIVAKALFFFKAEVQIGYLRAELAEEISEYLHSGGVRAWITNVTGGTKDKPSHGVNICIEKF